MSKTASIYLRRSKAAIDGQTVSFDFQEKEIRALLAQHDATVVTIFKDDGKSGNNMDRKPWKAWIESANEHDFIATWAIDRSSRGKAVLALYPLIMALQMSGARLLTKRDRLDSADPRFERDVIWEAQRAHEEWLSYSAKATATRTAMLDAGKWPAGAPPYGTRLDDERRLEIEPGERDVLREVAQRLLSGTSMRQVLVWLNEEGITTRRGNHWTRTSLSTTLKSDTSRRLIFTLAESRGLEERLHPKPGMRPKGGRPVAWLVSGYAVCAGCKRPMTTSRDAKRDVTRYVCPTTTTVAPCPARATIRADRADAFIEEEYLRLWGRRIQPKVVTVMEADHEIDEAERAQEAAQQAMVADPSDENVDAFRAARAALDAAKAKPVRRAQKTIGHDRLEDLWAAADPAGRAALLKRATNGIQIVRSTSPKWDSDRVQIDWK